MHGMYGSVPAYEEGSGMPIRPACKKSYFQSVEEHYREGPYYGDRIRVSVDGRCRLVAGSIGKV